MKINKCSVCGKEDVLGIDDRCNDCLRDVKNKIVDNLSPNEFPKCPHCNNTEFSVSVYAFQEWDSKDDEWGEVTVDGIDEGRPYMCRECGEEYTLEELK